MFFIIIRYNKINFAHDRSVMLPLKGIFESLATFCLMSMLQYQLLIVCHCDKHVFIIITLQYYSHSRLMHAYTHTDTHTDTHTHTQAQHKQKIVKPKIM